MVTGACKQRVIRLPCDRYCGEAHEKGTSREWAHVAWDTGSCYGYVSINESVSVLRRGYAPVLSGCRLLEPS